MQPSPIMIAPTGARLTRKDHPAVPISAQQSIECALQCREAGAHALHAHVRDAQHEHCLSVSQYTELLSLAANKLGDDFPVQITTEAFGKYEASDQMDLLKQLRPRFASVAVREIIRQPSDETVASQFYAWCTKERIGIQHILYSETDLTQFLEYKSRGIIPANNQAVIMVLGRYTDSMVADVNSADAVIDALNHNQLTWMMCAFGITETACLQKAALAGGAIRIGFENNQQNPDGSIAKDNAERVSNMCAVLNQSSRSKVELAHLHRILGAID